jgi:hypothetical protein
VANGSIEMVKSYTGEPAPEKPKKKAKGIQPTNFTYQGALKLLSSSFFFAT